MSSIPAQASPPTVREVAYRQLRQLILNGTLQPNQRIFEHELAERMGISRTPIREAMRQLETDGLVWLNARRGAVVAGLTAEGMREEFLIRAALETLAIKLAAQHLTPADFEALQREIDQMDDALSSRDGPTFLEHHRGFHLTLFAAARAPRLYAMLVNMHDSGERIRRLELGFQDLNDDEVAEHTHLLSLLRSGDGERAADEYIAEFLRRAEAVIDRLAQPRRRGRVSRQDGVASRPRRATGTVASLEP